MIFTLKADIEFEAENIDDALLFCKLKFTDMYDGLYIERENETLEHIGSIEIKPKDND